MGWGEWFVHETEHVCKEAEDAGLKHFTFFCKGLAYKSSLRDSISRWTSRGRNAKLENTEIESLRLDL